MLLQVEPDMMASFLRKTYNLRDQILEDQTSETADIAENFHVARKSKRGLQLTLRKGLKPKVHNATKDGLKIVICNA